MTDTVDICFDAQRGDQRYSAAAFEPYLEIEKAYPNGDKLPGVWITKPMHDCEGNRIGRNCVTLYLGTTAGLIPEDPDGEDALYYGGCYYDEAMGYTDPLEHDLRIECFQAAELLYRHSAGHGNEVAYLCLGYVYSYDRCEGRYWRGPMTPNAAEGCNRPYPKDERAFECFTVAAEAGICEACYKLGDLYKHGQGCSPNAGEAFRWYTRASDLMAHESPVIMGSVALRLGECHEEAIGCAQDFSRALEWYRKAESALEAAVEGGETWYAKALSSARAGAKRCEQETQWGE
jgi:TPR repeat protein